MTRLAVTAIALIALHVVDDAFLQPEPGTTAADHVLGGLVLLAILLVGLACFHRGHAGMRGTVTLALGVLGLAVGAEGIAAAAQGSQARDDYSGLLAAGAGVVLLGLGAATLWRSRRRDGGWARRLVRRTLVGVAGLVAALLVVVPVAAAYVITHVTIVSPPTVDLGLPHEQVTVTTADGLDLSGWYVPSRNGAAVIAVPGASETPRHARMLVEHGYGVLVLDHRGSGRNPGAPNLLGWNRTPDVHAAVEFLRGRPDVEAGRVGGIGLSVGGETLLQAAAESTHLEAVVSEGAGIRTLGEHHAVEGAKRWVELPSVAMAMAATSVFAGQSPPPALQDLVPRIAPRPLLLISAGHGVGGEELNALYSAAAGSHATWWEIPEARHTTGLSTRPDEYEHRVVGFFDDALLEGVTR
jgi:uncharacterized protein